MLISICFHFLGKISFQRQDQHFNSISTRPVKNTSKDGIKMVLFHVYFGCCVFLVCILTQSQSNSKDKLLNLYMSIYHRAYKCSVSLRYFFKIEFYEKVAGGDTNTIPSRDLNLGPTMDPSMKQMANQCATVLWSISVVSNLSFAYQLLDKMLEKYLKNQQSFGGGGSEGYKCSYKDCLQQ